MNPDKPGWATTEGWLAFATTAVTILASVGVLTLSEANTLEGVVKNVGAIVALAVPTAAALWGFIASRTKIKVAAIEQETRINTALVDSGHHPLQQHDDEEEDGTL